MQVISATISSRKRAFSPFSDTADIEAVLRLEGPRSGELIPQLSPAIDISDMLQISLPALSSRILA
jgi:hypothetical protein